MAQDSFSAPLQEGMTVLEVVVSLVIAGVFLSAMLPAIVQSYARFKLAEIQSRAVELATSKAEEVSHVTGRDSFLREGKENGLIWRIDAKTGDKKEVSPADGRPSLRTYTISVARDNHDPLIALEIQRLYTER